MQVNTEFECYTLAIPQRYFVKQVPHVGVEPGTEGGTEMSFEIPRKCCKPFSKTIELELDFFKSCDHFTNEKHTCYFLHQTQFDPKTDVLFLLYLRKFHPVNLFNGNFCEPGRAPFAEEKLEFLSQVVSKSNLFCFLPISNPFRIRSGRSWYTCEINLFMTWLVQ